MLTYELWKPPQYSSSTHMTKILEEVWTFTLWWVEIPPHGQQPELRMQGVRTGQRAHTTGHWWTSFKVSDARVLGLKVKYRMF